MSDCSRHEISAALNLHPTNHPVLSDSWKWVLTCNEEGGFIDDDAIGHLWMAQYEGYVGLKCITASVTYG